MMLQYTQERQSLKRWLGVCSDSSNKRCKGQGTFQDPISLVEDVNDSLDSHFVRSLPTDDDRYKVRLEQELSLIRMNNFEPVFLNVVTLLEHTKHIPHIVRGSAAGSLVSWMLGITNIDPIKHNMALERFMNARRPNKPDIDLDFPQHLRDEVISIMGRLFPDRVGRVCNHVKWKEASALQEACRQTFGVINDQTGKIVHSLVNTPRYDSLHCGGVVVFPSTVSKKLIAKESMLTLDKREVEEAGLVKIDLLSNRGLSILFAAQQRLQARGIKVPVGLDKFPTDDSLVVERLQRADLIGVTYCETPTMIKVIRYIQPTNPIELSLCLALARPAPNKQVAKERLQQGLTNLLVYDDDMIEYIADLLNTDLAEGESIRKALSKTKSTDEPAWTVFVDRLKLRYPSQQVSKIVNVCKQVQQYAFCKSHSMNYAYLGWALLWYKAHYNADFWVAVLSHASSQYADWVYVRQAISEGYTVEQGGKVGGKSRWSFHEPTKTLYCSSTEFTKQRSMEQFLDVMTVDVHQDSKVAIQQLCTIGYWTGPWPSCWFFSLSSSSQCSFYGLVAVYRLYKTKQGILTFITLGVGNGVYYNLTVDGEPPKGCRMVKGNGVFKGDFEIVAKSNEILYEC